MDEEQRTFPSEDTVACDIEKEVIGAESEIESEQSEEVMANAELGVEKQKSQGNGCESESLVIDLKVDEPTWKYMIRTQVYADDVKKVQSESQVIIVDSSFEFYKVAIKSISQDAVMKAKVEIERIFKKCKQEVRTVVLPKLDQEVYSKVISFLEENDTQNECTFIVELQNVILTGKEKDVDHLLGLLEETFGVSGAKPLSSDAKENNCPVNEQLNEIQDERDDHLVGSASKQTSDDAFSGKPSLKLLGNCFSPDEVDSELYGTEKNEFIELEDDALIVDEKIWCYLEKHPDYSEAVKIIKAKSNLCVMPEPVTLSRESAADRVRLVFTGSDEAEVRASVHETKSIIERCQEAGTKTLQVPCPELTVHQKITKLLKAINRLPSYVSVEPEVIAITGKAVEIENCLEKLKTYGLIYDVPPVQEESTFSVLEEDGEHRPVQEVVGNTYLGNTYEETPENSDSPEQFEHYRQLPVPVEEFLWLFIDRRRKQQLIDLRKDYNLQIIADGAGTLDFVNVTLASNSVDMLDCGQDALVSLIEHLRQQIVLGVLDTASPEDLPPELQGMLQQQCRDLESVIVLKGSKICIIGPNQEAMKCQQLIAAFMQNLVSDARNMGYDTSRMTSVGYNEGVEAAHYISEGSNPNYGPAAFGNQDYREEDYTGRVDDANLQQEQPNYGDGKFRSAGDNLYATPQDEFESVPVASETGSLYREPCISTDHEVPQEVVQKDTSAVRQQKADNNLDEESTLNVLHLNPVSRVNGILEKMSNSNISSGVQLEREQKDGDCSICHGDCGSSSNRHEMCHHHYCLSCVRLYFGESECPVCGTVESSSKQKISQPDSGLMLTTYDNSFRLPGFENSSRGTIIVTYAFPPGIQSEELPNPGRAYPGLTTTAFFPMCLEGSKVVDLLQRAFEKRLVFKVSQNQDNSSGNLVWNGILHKVNIFGGPRQYGYPDPIYLHRVSNDLAAKGIKDTN